MRKTVFEYIELSNTEKQYLWNNAVFVFDTNVYLNLYRYSKRTSDKLIGAMESFKERTWMPHRVAQEFMKNRVKVIFETKQNYDRIHNNANAFVEECKKTLNIKAIDDDTNITKLQEYLSKWIDNYQKDNLVVTELSKDTLLERILNLYEGKAGAEFSADELKELYSSGEERYKDKTPPGYKDSDKQDNDEKYGDFIIWKQILNYAQKEKKDIIFITNDVKEDWWEIVNGQKLGPRVELKREFHDQTSMKFNMYNDVQFITLFQENNSEPIDESMVNEMETVNENSDTQMNLFEQNYTNHVNQISIMRLEERMTELENLISDYETKLTKIGIKNKKRKHFLSVIDKKIKNLESNNQTVPRDIIVEQINTMKNYKKDSTDEKHLRKLLNEARDELNTLRKAYDNSLNGSPDYESFHHYKSVIF